MNSNRTDSSSHVDALRKIIFRDEILVGFVGEIGIQVILHSVANYVADQCQKTALETAGLFSVVNGIHGEPVKLDPQPPSSEPEKGFYFACCPGGTVILPQEEPKKSV